MAIIMKFPAEISNLRLGHGVDADRAVPFHTLGQIFKSNVISSPRSAVDGQSDFFATLVWRASELETSLQRSMGVRVNSLFGGVSSRFSDTERRLSSENSFGLIITASSVRARQQCSLNPDDLLVEAKECFDQLKDRIASQDLIDLCKSIYGSHVVYTVEYGWSLCLCLSVSCSTSESFQVFRGALSGRAGTLIANGKLDADVLSTFRKAQSQGLITIEKHSRGLAETNLSQSLTALLSARDDSSASNFLASLGSLTISSNIDNLPEIAYVTSDLSVFTGKSRPELNFDGLDRLKNFHEEWRLKRKRLDAQLRHGPKSEADHLGSAISEASSRLRDIETNFQSCRDNPIAESCGFTPAVPEFDERPLSNSVKGSYILADNEGDQAVDTAVKHADPQRSRNSDFYGSTLGVLCASRLVFRLSNSEMVDHWFISCRSEGEEIITMSKQMMPHTASGAHFDVGIDTLVGNIGAARDLKFATMGRKITSRDPFFLSVRCHDGSVKQFTLFYATCNDNPCLFFELAKT